MAKPKVTVHSSAIRKLLTGSGVKSDLRTRAERVASAARSGAPVVSGEYRGRITVVDASSATRARFHVGSTVPYALEVEADHGVMARALDSA